MKEVEKIQQKRDERRAKHLAIKEQNEQHFDTADRSILKFYWINNLFMSLIISTFKLLFISTF